MAALIGVNFSSFTLENTDYFEAIDPKAAILNEPGAQYIFYFTKAFNLSSVKVPNAMIGIATDNVFKVRTTAADTSVGSSYIGSFPMTDNVNYYLTFLELHIDPTNFKFKFYIKIRGITTPNYNNTDEIYVDTITNFPIKIYKWKGTGTLPF